MYLGNADLIGQSPSKLYKNRRVCEDHFNQEDILPNHKLIFKAVPKPFIPIDFATDETNSPASAPPAVASTSTSDPPVTSMSSQTQLQYPSTSTPESSKSPSKRLCIDPSSPSPVLFREKTTPKKYRSLLSSLTLSKCTPEFPSPQISTPSAVFWISNASPIPCETTQTERTTTLTPRNLFPKSTKRETSKKLQDLRKKLAVKRATISRLKRSAKQKTSLLSIKRQTIPHKSKEGQILFNMQYHKKRQPWKPEEKRYAICLYLRSPSCYKYLYKQMFLPGISTVKSWIASKDCFKPGFNSKLLQQVKNKVASMEEMEKSCVLMLDEMSIKQSLEYYEHFDVIEGYEDLGSLGRQPLVGKQACVFMVRGLYYPWKMPVGYFISKNGLTAKQTKTLILEGVELLTRTGLQIKAVVCDQCTTNVSGYKALGITSDNPWFKHAGVKIHALFDVPHLMKSVRNNLLKHNFLFEDKIVSFDDIRKLYDIDSNSQTTRAVPKLTLAHINPGPFQKINVALATQVLSHTTASALRTVVGTGQLKSKTALATADFLDFMNSLFDVLNSRVKWTQNPDSCALSKKNLHTIKLLEKGIDIFTNLKKKIPEYLETAKHHKSPQNTSMPRTKKTRWSDRPPCFEGMLLTIKSVLSLLDQESERYLLTSRLNQDALENLFSSIRQRGGWDRKPTVRTFRSSLRLYCLQYLIEPPKSTSYEPDCDEVLNLDGTRRVLSLPFEQPAGDDPTDDTGNAESTDSEEEDCDEPTNDAEPLEREPISLELCSQQYYAGYLAFMTYKKFSCQNCLNRQCELNSKLSDPI